MQKYTKEINDWLLENYSNHSINESLNLLYNLFGLKTTYSSLKAHCLKKLKIKSNKQFVSKEEKEWLFENYPADESREETYKKYCAQFPNIHRNYDAFLSRCKVLKLEKPEHRRKGFAKGFKPWSTGLSKEEFFSHYTAEGIAQQKKGIKNLLGVRNRLMYNDDVPENCTINDLRNGEYICIPNKIYKRMLAKGTLNKGELTLTDFEIYKVKIAIEDLKKA